MKLTRRRALIGLASATVIPVAATAAWTSQHRYYDGPVSDHFDGTRFFDRHGAPPNSLLKLLRWRSQGDRADWPDADPSPFSDRPPRSVEGRPWRISFVGHASFLLQTAGLNILMDPMWSDRASPFGFVGPKRVNAPGIAFDGLPPVHAVLVSHNHYDHLDLATLGALATPHRPRVVTPLGNDAIIRGHDSVIAVEARDWGERIVLSPQVAVTLVPARHWSARGPFDRNKALWAAFIIETPAGRILHVGDSGYGDGWHFRYAREKFGPFRLAILPIGAYEPRWFMREQHMTPAEAVRAFRDSGAEFALGHHYGTFQLSDEAIDAPSRALDEARVAAGISPAAFRLLKPGEVWEI